MFLGRHEVEKMSTTSSHLALIQSPEGASQIQGNHSRTGWIILSLKEAWPNEGICQARNPTEGHREIPRSSARFVHVTGYK